MAQTYYIKPQAEMMLKEKAFDYGITKPEIPKYISNNLKYSFFDWQQ